MDKFGPRCCRLRTAILIEIPLLLLLSIAASAQTPSPAASAKREIEAPLKWPGEPSGADRCILCHRSEVEGYAQSAMAHSLRRSGNEPDGSVTTEDTKVTASKRKNGYWQHLESGGQSTDYRIDYVIGSGNHASGYLLDLSGHLFQSPIAYYRSRKSYDLAPGYEGLRNPDFTRPVTEGCLFCHSGTALPVPGARNQYRSPPFSAESITCERCHGPVEEHLENPRAGTIVNPAKLEPVARDSICEQCHLLGVGRTLNPGMKFSDFRPGERLEDVFTTYHLALPAGTDAGKFKVISHVEQLARSTCSRMSDRRMWCGTCHDPHEKPVDPVEYFRNKCLSCHTAAFSSSHPDRNSNCIGCHMPRRNAKDGGHTVFTDHRIERRVSVPQDLPANVDVAAWREPALEFQKRNLGMSYINLGAEQRSPKFFIRGYKLLTEVQQQFSTDDGLFTSIGIALLLGKHPAEAEFAFDRAVELNDSVSAETNDASAYLQAGNADQAMVHLERAVAIDPMDLTAVEPLADLYRKKGNVARADELSLKVAAALAGQTGPSGTSEPVSSHPILTAEKRYKNIQALKGIPADQLIPAMRSMTQSLGVQCSYCHIPNHFEDDTKKTKHTARKMMQMMSTINSGSFDGVRAVTCYSCHRGAPQPESTPEIVPAPERESASIRSIDKDVAAALPTADEIVEKYVHAMGGAAAIEAVLTRQEHGTLTSGGTTAPVEILDKFPDRHALIRRSPKREDFTILNGRRGWFGTSGSIHDLESSELDNGEIAADLHLPLVLDRVFGKLLLEYPTKSGQRNTYVLLGGSPGTPAAKLFFDQESGLLIRIVQFIDSPLGRIETETDYDDYRIVDGVKVPFRLRLSEGNETSTVQVEEVLENVPIEDQRFEKPTP